MIQYQKVLIYTVNTITCFSLVSIMKKIQLKIPFEFENKSDAFEIEFNTLRNYNHLELTSKSNCFINIDAIIIDDPKIDLPGPTINNLPDRFVIGHRGAGNNQIVHDFLENTIPSFHEAYKNGARCVEMDVQLANGGIPIVIHPFLVTLPHKSATGRDPIKIDEKGNYLYCNQDITVEEHQESGLNTEYNTLRCTYSGVLTQLPEDLSILTEVKYPCSKELEKMIPFEERNAYVDILLKELKEHGKNRTVILGSFDPTLVISFAVRQKRYPVALLINPSNGEELSHVRDRIRTFFPLLEKLGIAYISTDPRNLLPECKIIDEATKLNISFMTYYYQEQTKEYYEMLMNHGIASIISDYIQPYNEAVEKLKKVGK
ncbi:Glycerophosphoryl diester phosphodiesterase family protein [Trichomonas vaginalis G3]|uniref:Glycerophosphoryl diester phosphodiesterase family protein n=1 Tax=Trichomonas vaginalis (strain ATCC PRA-98 / G3) TaxID=412133 RepID=A2EQA1_TRIV3|nr:glycerophosphocholine phosphodiesterase protein [Trichomonas vaginalis G3]EAY05184.1 Glycerophosphoryl diester phosphodiesterase family protein [Trichomonas vaginalis G3]KAI5522954.1 glycerophosphocholine phosphodiesterase protein [Trichomonas vaginalis G3]|eukprot:XP_001317407.1 Glycerophosphoryl diester phosphodiesterase family protein [Trichomonas vaginalis G3]